MADYKLFGNAQSNVKYSSVPTRYASMHNLQNGADFNETFTPPQLNPGEMPNDWNFMNIRSGCNVTDLPSRFGEVKYGTRKVGNLVFTSSNDYASWLRRRGEW